MICDPGGTATKHGAGAFAPTDHPRSLPGREHCVSVHPSAPSLADLRDELLADLRDDLCEAAECRFDPELHTGPDLFEAEPHAAREAREAVAKQICADCPVRLVCLDYALRKMPDHGVWAGFTADDLAVVAAARELLGEVA